jgi:hypothetical protein
MNKTRNIHNKNNKFIVASIVIVVALAMIARPIVTMDDAFATKKKKNNGNVAEESISQSQPSVQNALWPLVEQLSYPVMTLAYKIKRIPGTMH